MFHTVARTVALGVLAAGAILVAILGGSGIASSDPDRGDMDHD